MQAIRKEISSFTCANLILVGRLWALDGEFSMKIDRVVILGLSMASAAALSANAADIYVPGYKDAPYVVNWAGGYAGVNIGGVTGNLDAKDKDFLNGGASYSLSDTAAIGGLQIGFNFQSGNFVFGVEGDFGYADLSARKFDPLSAGTTYSQLDNGAYGDMTGRIGYSFGPVLIYGKGGYAFYTGQASVTTGLLGGGFGTTGLWEGWTAGGGVEYLLTPSWSMKIEYQHFDFGRELATITAPGGTASYANDLTMDAVKIGINYIFGRETKPLK